MTIRDCKELGTPIVMPPNIPGLGWKQSLIKVANTLGSSAGIIHYETPGITWPGYSRGKEYGRHSLVISSVCARLGFNEWAQREL